MGVCQGRELRHREHRLRLLRTRHNNWAASQGSMAAPLDAPDEGRGATTAARVHPHHAIRRRSRTRRPGSGPRLTVLAPIGARSQADFSGLIRTNSWVGGHPLRLNPLVKACRKCRSRRLAERTSPWQPAIILILECLARHPSGEVSRMELSQIPLSNITPNPENPRGIKIDTQDPKLSYLKDSIAQFGVLVPLVVTPRVGNYLLVDGGTTPRKRLD